MVRTTKLRSLRRRILRFTTPGRPGAAAACCVALWQLPRPDFHRLVIRTFQGAPFWMLARLLRESTERFDHLRLKSIRMKIDDLYHHPDTGPRPERCGDDSEPGQLAKPNRIARQLHFDKAVITSFIDEPQIGVELASRRSIPSRGAPSYAGPPGAPRRTDPIAPDEAPLGRSAALGQARGTRGSRGSSTSGMSHSTPPCAGALQTHRPRQEPTGYPALSAGLGLLRQDPLEIAGRPGGCEPRVIATDPGLPVYLRVRHRRESEFCHQAPRCRQVQGRVSRPYPSPPCSCLS